MKRRLFAPLAALALAGPAQADGPVAYRGYQAPAYSVVRTLGAVEIRDYPAMTVAEVRIEGGRSRAVGRGFRILAGYIFGANAGGEKIAMTTPVEQAPVAAGDDATVWAIRFVMPRGASPDSLPAPEDPAIRLIVAEPGRQAVLRFSGLATPGTVAARSTPPGSRRPGRSRHSSTTTRSPCPGGGATRWRCRSTDGTGARAKSSDEDFAPGGFSYENPAPARRP